MNKPKWLTPRRRSNLETLAAFLDALPPDYDHFDMGDFASKAGKPAHQELLDDPKGFYRHCGTVACAVGHGPAAGFPLAKGDIREGVEDDGWLIDWARYSHRNFIPSCQETHFGDVWDWCFGGSWEVIDNTPRGAAARIRYILAGNEIPGGFDDLGYFDADPIRPASKKLYEKYLCA